MRLLAVIANMQICHLILSLFHYMLVPDAVGCPGAVQVLWFPVHFALISFHHPRRDGSRVLVFCRTAMATPSGRSAAHLSQLCTSSAGQSAASDPACYRAMHSAPHLSQLCTGSATQSAASQPACYAAMLMAKSLVCHDLAFESIMQLAAVSTSMQKLAFVYLSVPVCYVDNAGAHRVLVQVTRWETLQDVQAMVCRFVGSSIASVYDVWTPSRVKARASGEGWLWTPDRVAVHHGTRWSQTGVGLDLKATGLLRMSSPRNGTLQLADDSVVSVVMATGLTNWREYNERNGHSQGDYVEASCSWKGGVISVTEMDDLPSTLGSRSDSETPTLL